MAHFEKLLYLMDLGAIRTGVFLNDWLSGLHRTGVINLTLCPGVLSVPTSVLGDSISWDKLGKQDFLFKMLRVACSPRDPVSECLLLFIDSLTFLWWIWLSLFFGGALCLIFVRTPSAGLESDFLTWEAHSELPLAILPGNLFEEAIFTVSGFKVDESILFTASLFWLLLWFSAHFWELAIISFDFTWTYFWFVFNGVCVFFLKRFKETPNNFHRGSHWYDSFHVKSKTFHNSSESYRKFITSYLFCFNNTWHCLLEIYSVSDFPFAFSIALI